VTDDRPLVVYVDDEFSNRLIFEQGFKSRFRIEVFGTAQEALTRLDETPVAVLITDQRMPGMSGTELLRRARERHPHTQRVIITAYEDPIPMLDALNDGLAARYLVKPWAREEVESVVNGCIEMWRLYTERGALQSRLAEIEKSMAAVKAAIDRGSLADARVALEQLEKVRDSSRP